MTHTDHIRSSHVEPDAVPHQPDRSSTRYALTTLSDLVATARSMIHDAPTEATQRSAINLAHTLDAARTALTQEGDDYLESAWAFIDAGRRLIAATQINIARAKR